MKQKKKKNIFVAISMFLLVIIISSCGNDSESEEVKKRLEGYCETIKKGELDKTSKYLGSEPDYMVDMNENVLNMFTDIFRDSVSDMEYTIENIEIDETQETFSYANAMVCFQYIDYSEVMSVSLEHLENEFETGAISQDASDEEIYQYLYEIFMEEQKSSDKEWNEIEIEFLLLKNRNKSNPVWLIHSIPEDISTILTCNTEVSFEKYGETSNEKGTENTEGYKRYRFGIGEMAEFESGLAITLMDAGKYSEYYYGESDTYAYVSFEIENRGSENIVFSSANIEFYGDGYLLDTGIVFSAEDVLGTIELSPGRRAKGRVFAECENYDSLSVIEAEYSNVIFVVKNEEDDEPIGDEGVEVYMENVSEMVGTYSDIEDYGIQVIIEQNEYGMADITFKMEGEKADYIFEDCSTVDDLLLFEIYDVDQTVYVSLDAEGYLSVSGCEMKTYNSIFEKVR